MSLTKLNLEKIKKNIEEALDKESVESLTKWLLEHREKKAKIFLQPDVIKSVCEHEGRKFEDGWTYCIKCTEFMY